jgi:membrane-bound serine protease (ClpP class)
MTALLIGFPPVYGQEQSAEPVPAAPPQLPGATAAILPIHGEITDITSTSLKRRIDDAREKGATVIVFELDTPGGLVTSSIAIADQIKNLSGVKTVAWVNTNAHSGGSIVAVACEEIVMAKSSRMGDSQVIMGGPGGVGAVPEELQPKAYTPVLAEFRASARLRGYDQVLCESFVLPQREVWWLENINTGEREFVFREEKLKRFGEKEEAKKDDKEEKESDVEVTKDPDFVPEWKLVEKYHDPVLDMEVETIQPVVRSDQLLEMSPGEAHAYGFSKGIVKDRSELRERYNLASITNYSLTWSETLAYWLTSIYVRGFLMVIIMLGAYVEFHTPGVGVPGLVALICLAIFVAAPYMAGLANVWEIVLIAVGVLLILLEVFVIPGFGIAGIAGIILVLMGLIATFVPDEPGRSFPIYLPSLPSTMQWLEMAIKTVVSSMIVSLIGMYVLSKFLPRLPVFRMLVPANPTPSEVAVTDPYRGAARVGDTGRAEGPLRPAGKARFGSMLVDVVTQGEYLEADAEVEVIERRGNRVVVRSVR